MGKLNSRKRVLTKMAKAVKQGRILKYGRVVILLQGRYAGRKGVIVKVHDDSNENRKFPHALVAGINRYPRRVHKKLSKKNFDRKIKIKPFLKYVNLNHLMPTRHILSQEIDLEEFGKRVENIYAKTKDVIANPEQRSNLRKALKQTFERKYKALDLNSSEEKALKMKFFFKKLRF